MASSPNDESPTVERRQHRRRASDIEEHEIVERAIEQAPLVSRLLRTGKVAAACLALGGLLGGVGGAMGTRITGPADDIRDVRAQIAKVDTTLNRRIDSTSSKIARVEDRQDSLLVVLNAVNTKLEFQSYTQCIMLRRFAPDLRPQGCDAAERRGGTSPQPR